MTPTFKIVFVGDSSVGKTTILTRYVHDQFSSSYAATVGVDFLSKTMYVDGRSVRMQLWDTAGQERFRSLVPTYIRKASVALVVYDVSNSKSLKSLSMWLDLVTAESVAQPLICIVANKCDLQESACDTTVQDRAADLGALYFHVSAKTGENITELFKAIGRHLLRVHDEYVAETSVAISLSTIPEQDESDSCC